MPRRAERCLQIAPHSLAIVLGAAAGEKPGGGGGACAGGGAGGGAGGVAGPAAELGRHRIGYEIFADFKRENMQHHWDRRATAAVAETFFLGWIDEQVLLVQGKEEHLEVLRQGWARRSLKPPSGFHIKCLVKFPLDLTKQCWRISGKSHSGDRQVFRVPPIFGGGAVAGLMSNGVVMATEKQKSSGVILPSALIKPIFDFLIEESYYTVHLNLLERSSQITWGSADTKLKTTDLIKPSI
ncbi:hypothetical protein Q9966_009208 [Columba livia]|nr:hypothetical protein Q9966_009208 [Columba livia]